MNAQKVGRLALTTATAGFFVGMALLNGGSSNAIGGLCNGSPASHTWLDASGQYGPALNGGNDTVDGGDEYDVILGNDGDDVVICIDDGAQDECSGDGDFDVCLPGPG